jgi:hypothetical protein
MGHATHAVVFHHMVIVNLLSWALLFSKQKQQYLGAKNKVLFYCLRPHPLIACRKRAIVMTHCELDLVEHTLIDPKSCKFGNVVRIDMTLPIVFAETLEAEWKNAGIEVFTVQSYVGKKLMSGEGKLRGHLSKEYLARTLTAIKNLQCLYVDDGAFIFASPADMM